MQRHLITVCCTVLATALTASEPYLDAKVSPSLRAEDLLKRMTLEEKIDYLGGDRDFYIRAIPRLQVPEIKMSDGPMGCRNYGETTCYGGGVALAASWDPVLAGRIGAAMGRDCRARGVHILLAPGVNISRSPLCGRNFEYMGEDPLLAGKMASAMICGLKAEGVLATVKHFACNNQEWDRNSISSEVDERTLREIYLPAFRMAVKEGGVDCVMTAYNPLNGVHCAHDSVLVDHVLKREWGFSGFVMSDWGAVHEAQAAALGGTDLEMGQGKYLNKQNLLPLIQAGTVSEAVIDGKVRRILNTLFAAGFFDRTQERKDVPFDDPTAAAVALDGARAGIVLAKNDRGLLPINSATIRTVLVVGPNAHPAVYCGSGSGFTRAFHSVSIMDGMRSALPNAKIIHQPGLQMPLKDGVFSGRDELIAAAKAVDLVVACVGWGQSTDANSAAFTFNVGWPEQMARTLGVTEAEESDRPFALHPAQVETLRVIAGVNKRVVVVLNAGAGVDPRDWADQVPALLCAWYPGQAVGTAVAEILTGAVNPSAKLPVTFARSYDDYPSSPFYHQKKDNKTPYSEGVNVGYRGFDAANINPWFCFGHGMSYTTFTYDALTVTPANDGTMMVSFTVKNTGSRAGSEVAQVYVTPASAPVTRPPKELKGFAKVALAPGELKKISVVLPADACAYWSPTQKAWTTEKGIYGIVVGASSRDIRLTGTIKR